MVGVLSVLMVFWGYGVVLLWVSACLDFHIDDGVLGSGSTRYHYFSS